MRSRWWALLAGVIALALVVVAATVDDGRAHAAPPSSARASLPVRSATLVCPDVTGSPLATGTATVSRVPRGRSGAAAPALSIRTLPTSGQGTSSSLVVPDGAATRTSYGVPVGAIAITATGDGAGGVAAMQSRLRSAGSGRALLSTSCLPPGSDWWITGAEGRVGYFDTLVVSNPGTVSSNITVTAWAATGPLKPPGLTSYTVGAGHSARLAVSSYAPDAALVALHVHANSGRVTAQLLDMRIAGTTPVGSDWIPPSTPPARDSVVPGLPAGAGSRRLILVNPGGTDASVGLRLSTAAGNFVPAGHPTVVVQAQHTVEVDLTSSLADEAGAVLLHSDQPVTATALVQLTQAGGEPDLAWLPAAAPLGPVAVLPDNAPPFRDVVRLHLTALAGAASVRLIAGTAQRTVAVPNGRTVTVDPEQLFGGSGFGPLVLEPLTSAPVYASRFLEAHGDHGALATTGAPYSLPQPVPLPAAIEDLRAALP